MQSFLTRGLVGLFAGAMLLGLTGSALAQNGGDARIAELLDEVQRLKSRVFELETENAEHDSEGLEARVNALSDSLAVAGANDMAPYWKTGFRLDNGDKAFRLKIGGRIMNDWIFGTQDNDLEQSIGRFEDGTEFRRARLFISGQIHEHVIFKAQYDFADGDADFRDVYVGLRKIGFIDRIRVGHFFQPQGLETQTSSKYITFLERSLVDVFSPARETGLGFNGTALENDRMTWFVSVFRDVDDYGDSSPAEDGKYNFGIRLTGLLIDDMQNHTLLHIGASFVYRNPNGDTYRIRQRPGVHLSDRFVDTGSFGADDGIVATFEMAFVWQSFSLQGELYYASFDGNVSGDPDPEFWGFYVFASYFLTGEHRPYDRAHGVFGRVKPNNNFMENGGSGAWEVAARYSYIDLNDDGIQGGQLCNFTFGVNWYLNPNTRVMFNYVYANVDDLSGGGEGEAHIVGFRFQIDF